MKINIYFKKFDPLEALIESRGPILMDMFITITIQRWIFGTITKFTILHERFNIKKSRCFATKKIRNFIWLKKLFLFQWKIVFSKIILFKFKTSEKFDSFKIPTLTHVIAMVIIIVLLCGFILLLKLFLETTMLIIIGHAHLIQIVASTLCVNGIFDGKRLPRFGNGEHLARLVTLMFLKVESLAAKPITKIRKQDKENNAMALF